MNHLIHLIPLFLLALVFGSCESQSKFHSLSENAREKEQINDSTTFKLPYAKGFNFDSLKLAQNIVFDTSFHYYIRFPEPLALLGKSTSMIIGLHLKDNNGQFQPLITNFLDHDTTILITPDFNDDIVKINYLVNQDTVLSNKMRIIPRIYYSGVTIFDDLGETTDSTLIEWHLKLKKISD